MNKDKKELLYVGAIILGLLIVYSIYDKKYRGVAEDEVIPTEFEN
jgi:hypothetical protein